MKIIFAAIIGMTLGVLWLYAPPMSAERRAWELMRPRSYSFEFRYTCFCPRSGAWWRISVRDESVLYYRLVEPSQLAGHFPALQSPPIQLPSLSTIFDDIAQRGSESTYYRVKYDPRWHFPIYASGDRVFWTDSYWTMSVRNFHPDPKR